MKRFSDEERDRIREQLIENGRDLILTYGPDKTTVKDLTETVGIAKPTFYQFFDSKSEIYLLILEREIDTYISNVRKALAENEDPQDALEAFFWCYVEFGEENPLVQELVIRGNHRTFLSTMDWDALEDMQRRQWSTFTPLIEDLKERSDGPITTMDAMTIGGIMSAALGWFMIHKGEYEEFEQQLEQVEDGYYTHIQQTLISTLARGLTS